MKRDAGAGKGGAFRLLSEQNAAHSPGLGVLVADYLSSKVDDPYPGNETSGKLKRVSCDLPACKGTKGTLLTAHSSSEQGLLQGTKRAAITM